MVSYRILAYLLSYLLTYLAAYLIAYNFCCYFCLSVCLCVCLSVCLSFSLSLPPFPLSSSAATAREGGGLDQAWLFLPGDEASRASY